MNHSVFFYYQAPPNLRSRDRVIPDGEQEFELVLEGFGVFFIDGQEHRLGPGDFIRFQPHDRIQVDADAAHPYFCAVIHCREEEAFPFFRRCGRLHSPEFARSLAHQAAELFTRNRITAADLAGWLGIFHQAQRAAQLAEEAIALPPAVDRTLQYLKKNYARRLTVARLAVIAGVSAPHLFALFRQTLGISPMRLTTNLRLEAAGTMLTSETLSVKEIAFRCGFVNAVVFGAVFKRQYGHTPGAYRKLFADKS